ncbi:bride of doubletime [Haematobia irritans]|uniref:bride of doubletime n=1 Tax=Haematobia irritans TaxID=7368 RepID=UPI003F50B61B
MEWYIGSEWQLERKGLHKKVLDLHFSKLEKPHRVSTVIISVSKVENLENRESVYLTEDNLNVDQCMEMGTALCPVDYYLDMLIQQMLIGEKALCTIKTKGTGNPISITVTLKSIKESKEIQKLTVPEMYNLALRYKENGVKMFKTYPIFAHEYFVRAAKCLISFKNFEPLTKKNDGMSGKDMHDLLVQVQTNLAACLLNAKRYEDVIYQTKFVENQNSPSEKAIYRRAMAYYYLAEFDLAQKTIEKVPDYKDKKEFLSLHQKITERRKTNEDSYRGMVKKMFG